VSDCRDIGCEEPLRSPGRVRKGCEENTLTCSMNHSPCLQSVTDALAEGAASTCGREARWLTSVTYQEPSFDAYLRDQTSGGRPHMRSRLRRTGQRSTAGHSLSLLLLLLVAAAKPADHLGSRGRPTAGRRREWNTPPKANWWQYKCPVEGCNEFCQDRDEPTEYVFCRNRSHGIRVTMELIHDPRRG